MSALTPQPPSVWRSFGVRRATERRPPPPALRELVDVIPVGRSARRGEVTLTLLSVERYGDGFVALFRLLQEHTAPDPALIAAPPMPELRLQVIDDRSGAYDAWPHGGGGGGGHGLLDWRLGYVFAPAPDPGVRELRLTAAEIAWRRFDQEHSDLVDAGTTPGPWTFVVPLA